MIFFSLKRGTLKESIRKDISERKAREALGYLEHKGYFNSRALGADQYVLSDKGLAYLEKLLKEKQLI
jgi:hypothetical protein